MSDVVVWARHLMMGDKFAAIEPLRRGVAPTGRAIPPPSADSALTVGEGMGSLLRRGLLVWCCEWDSVKQSVQLVALERERLCKGQSVVATKQASDRSRAVAVRSLRLRA